MCHVSSRSGVATLRTAIHLLLTYLLTFSNSAGRAEIDTVSLPPAFCALCLKWFSKLIFTFQTTDCVRYRRRHFCLLLDKYWAYQKVVFNFSSELTGTGGLPVCM